MVANLAADIIMDVAKAADPGRFKVAVNKLESGADYAAVANDVALAFSAVDDADGRVNARKGEVQLPFDVERARLRLGGRDGIESGLMQTKGQHPNKTYEQFEALILQHFVEAMLPKESVAVFGKGFAGDMWKSLLAQQMAEELAKVGGVGIAKAVEEAHPRSDNAESARKRSA